MEMLQRNEKDHKYGYFMSKKVKWERLQEKKNQHENMQLIKEPRKPKQIIDVKLETEKLERVEIHQKENAREGVEVLVCEREHGPLLFESNKQTEELNHMNDSEQPEELMTEASNETLRSCVFKNE